MVTDLVQIRCLVEAEETENLHFRRFLKAHHAPDRAFHRIAHDFEAQIDCTACANCCREPRVSVSRADIEALALYLDMPPTKIIKEYKLPDPQDRETILRQTGNG